MIGNKLLYAGLVVISGLFFLLYRGRLSFELLVFALLFPLLLLIWVLVFRWSLSVRLNSEQKTVRKGDTWHWNLEIRNRSIFSATHAKIRLEYYNNLSRKQQTMVVVLPIVPCNTQNVKLSFHADTCGIMGVRITEIRIYDPLRIFCGRKKLNLHHQVMIYPTILEQLALVPPPDNLWNENAEEYSKERPGDDSSEVFDVHAYREGDLISRIHWKLSARQDALMVKEFSQPIQNRYVLLTDYRMGTAEADGAVRLDYALSAMSSMIHFLSEEQLRCALSFCGTGKEFIISDEIASDTESLEWLHQLLVQQPVSAAEQERYFQQLQHFLMLYSQKESIILFTPYLDDALCRILMSLPLNGNIMVYHAVSQQETEHTGEQKVPYQCIPVLMNTKPGTAVPVADASQNGDGKAGKRGDVR
ncbi:MAG: DUF58 domain-containing protein [Oscillospiraceae bacterium]|nr:DUF58 domain-containing protein [Oscillospiraceae bacterium]